MPRKIYDVESFLSDIETALKTYLNPKLASIDTEKGDGITLKAIDSDAYFLQELNSRVANFNPFILYGVEDLGTIAQQGNAAKNVVISIVIVIADDGEDNKITNRLLRYSRALEEVFSENFCLIRNAVKLTIQNLMPVAFELENSSDNFRAVGINVTGSIC